MLPLRKPKPSGSELQSFSPLDATRALHFSVVAEKNSITRAAQSLGVNASTVSRHLDELETNLGVRLLERDTRNLRLTEAGESYLHYVLKAIGALESGRQTMSRYSVEVRGQLRVLCPPAIGRQFVADLVVAFGVLHPHLQVSLKLDSKPFALADTDFDVAICLGMPVEDRAVVSKLGELRLGFVATPDFLKKYGTPDSIYALAKLPITEVGYDYHLHEQVVLANAKGEIAYAVTKLPTNDTEVALRAVLSGEYIGRMKYWYCASQLASGQLVKVMPELEITKAIYTVVALRKGKPLKVQLFVDFLKNYLGSDLKALEDLAVGAG